MKTFKGKIKQDEFEYVVGRLNELGMGPKFTERSVGSDEVIVHYEDTATVPTKQQLKNLRKEYRDKGAGDYDPFNLRNKTKEQVETYIDNNVTDLASAKTFLKALAKIVLWLYKKQVEEEV